MIEPPTFHNYGYSPEPGQLMCIHFVAALLRLLMLLLVTIKFAGTTVLALSPHQYVCEMAFEHSC